MNDCYRFPYVNIQAVTANQQGFETVARQLTAARVHLARNQFLLAPASLDWQNRSAGGAFVNDYEILDWERTVILELNEEHESTCRMHKVHLRPIAITLFDSDTRWGQFDGLTRTISISRRLVNEHPWHHVVGVLRHEMAHQYVAEQYPQNFQTDRPHSELFKEACKRLGVPDQFAKAGLDLQTCGLDWRAEPRDEATERILDKAKKLLALANSTNEHEAHLAMERVRELYAKYNVDHMDTLSKENFVHLVITDGKKGMRSWEHRIISILAEHFFVEVIICRQFHAKSGQTVHALELIGTRENVLMAEYVYRFLSQQVEFLVTKTAKSQGGLGRTGRLSFRLGVLDGFDKKLRAAEKAQPSPNNPKEKGALTVIGEALAKYRKNSNINDYISEIYPRLGIRKRSSHRIDGDAFAAGHAAGKSITLNKPISTNMGNLGKVLNSRGS